MTDFSFNYNLDRDLENYRQSVVTWQRTDHATGNVQKHIFDQLPQKLQNNLEKAQDEGEKLKAIKIFLEDQQNTHQELYQLSTATLETAWELRDEEIINRLENFFEKPFDFEQIEVNFTTLPVRPYNFNERYLMVSFRQSLSGQLKTVVHELFHFMLHAHYDEYLKDKIDNFSHYESIKEALTVFINTDFLDLVMVPDTGYPKEQRLRQKLLQLDRDKYDFKDILGFPVKESRTADNPTT